MQPFNCSRQSKQDYSLLNALQNGIGSIENLDEILALLGRANLETLLEMMLRDFLERPKEIARAAAAGEWPAVERSCHLLLGSARYIGAPRLIDRLLSIEAVAHRGAIAHGAIAVMIEEAATLQAEISVWRLANPV